MSNYFHGRQAMLVNYWYWVGINHGDVENHILRRFAHAAAPVIIIFWDGGFSFAISSFQFWFVDLDILKSLCVGELQGVFRLWDPSRSIQLVKLYNIARNRLLGPSERRFWVDFGAYLSPRAWNLRPYLFKIDAQSFPEADSELYYRVWRAESI